MITKESEALIYKEYLEQLWELWRKNYLAGLPVGDEFPFARELIEARKHSTE